MKKTPIGLLRRAGHGSRIPGHPRRVIGFDQFANIKRGKVVSVLPMTLPCVGSVSYTHLDVYKRQAETFSPKMQISPAVGDSKPEISRRQVVLPDPEGPSMAKNAPSAMVRSTPSTALTGAEAGPK